MRSYALGIAAAAALFIVPVSAFSQGIEIGPGGVRFGGGGRGGAMRAAQAGVREQGCTGRAGRGQLPTLPRDV